jgi:hypothetical protein
MLTHEPTPVADDYHGRNRGATDDQTAVKICLDRLNKIAVDKRETLICTSWTWEYDVLLLQLLDDGLFLFLGQRLSCHLL